MTREELIAILKDLEWALPQSEAGIPCCPWCWNAQIFGHKENCRLSVALKEER